MKFIGNQSLAFEFYDLLVTGGKQDHLKFTLLLILGIIIFGFAVKYKILRVN
jgi:hypothetical protein